jgi:hypothetical protein
MRVIQLTSLNRAVDLQTRIQNENLPYINHEYELLQSYVPRIGD